MNVKSGWQTTEFWVTVINAIAALIIGYGLMTQEEADLWIELLKALLPLAVASAGYSISRGVVKR